MESEGGSNYGFELVVSTYNILCPKYFWRSETADYELNSLTLVEERRLKIVHFIHTHLCDALAGGILFLQEVWMADEAYYTSFFDDLVKFENPIKVMSKRRTGGRQDGIW